MTTKTNTILYESDRMAAREADAILHRVRSRAASRTKNRIALIQPRKGGRPALGLLYLGAYLKEGCFDVKIFEFLDELYPPNKRYNRGLWRDLVRFKPDFIGFGVLSSYCAATTAIIQKIRQELPEVVIICGGKHSTSNPEDLLVQGADLCVTGEGEITLVDLLDTVNFNEPLQNVKGVAYRSGEHAIRTEDRKFLPLDAIMRPAFELIDYQRYIDMRLQSIPGHFLRAGFILTNRGCPFNCHFCSQNIKGLFRERPIDDVIDELRWQLRSYSIEAFVILDDLFYFKEGRTIEFCEKILRNNIRVKFYCHTRVDIIRKETAALMKRAGFIMFAIGVESGSDKILRAMNKRFTTADIEKAFQIYRDVGIDTFSHIILGHPLETDEDRDQTRKLLSKIHPTMVAVNYYMPMPGTKSMEFDPHHAKYLLGEKRFRGFTYTHDYPEFSMTIPLEALKRIGDELNGLAAVDRNKNLFRYPSFLLFIIKFLVFQPGSLIEAFIIRFVTRKTTQMSLFAVVKDAIQFHAFKFKNP